MENRLVATRGPNSYSWFHRVKTVHRKFAFGKGHKCSVMALRHKTASCSRRTDTRLTVRLLVPSAGTGATELLRLAAAGVGNQQAAVVCQEDGLDLVLGDFADDCKRNMCGVGAVWEN